MVGVLGVTSLALMPWFDVVLGMVPDYMHGCLLGVTKTLLYKWFSATNHKKPYFIGGQVLQWNHLSPFILVLICSFFYVSIVIFLSGGSSYTFAQNFDRVVHVWFWFCLFYQCKLFCQVHFFNWVFTLKINFWKLLHWLYAFKALIFLFEHLSFKLPVLSPRVTL